MAVDFQLQRNAFGRLVLTDAQGEHHEGVLPVRAFPIAAPTEGISLVSRDGHERAWIERLSELPEPMRTLIEEAFAAREFVPVIQRIVSVSTFSTPSTWVLETDRGAVQMVLKSEESIRRLPDGEALLITSGSGVQFRVIDREGLDRASQRLLERFL